VIEGTGGPSAGPRGCILWNRRKQKKACKKGVRRDDAMEAVVRSVRDETFPRLLFCKAGPGPFIAQRTESGGKTDQDKIIAEMGVDDF